MKLTAAEAKKRSSEFNRLNKETEVTLLVIEEEIADLSAQGIGNTCYTIEDKEVRRRVAGELCNHGYDADYEGKDGLRIYWDGIVPR